MKALTVTNPGRIVNFGPVLDLLVSKKKIESWYAISIENRSIMSKSIDNKYKDKIVYLENKFFYDKSAANDYLYSLSLKNPYFEFGKVIASEKYVHKHFSDGIIGISNMIKNLEESFMKIKPDILISGYPASAVDMVVYQFCKWKEIQTIYIGDARLPNRLYFSYEPDKGLKELIAYKYYEYRKERINNNIRKNAERYLKSFREDKLKPSWYRYFESTNQKDGSSLKLKNLMSILRKTIISPDEFIPKLKKEFEHKKLMKNWKKIFSSLDKNDRIIFFPIQYSPEASTFVRGPFFKNQYALIENLCIGIPPGFTLYVKEHPSHINQKRKPLNFYLDFLKRFPNLKFLDTSLDSHDIIKESELVAVVSSTAGWEAFLYGVPVLLFGTSFYSPFKGIYPFKSFSSIREQIKEILTTHEYDEEEILLAVAASLEGTLPGNHSAEKREGIEERVNTVIKGIKFYPEWLAFKEPNKEVLSIL